MKKTSLVKEPVDFANVGEKISHELAAKMVKNHYDRHGKENTFSYTSGKQIIMAILDQPGCVGLKLVDAINEVGDQTLVFVGVDAEGRNLTEITIVNDLGKLAVTEGMVADRTLKNNWMAE